jgi:hypothetical protein
MRVLYLGELLPDSYVVDCLQSSGKFTRVDHLPKPSLDLGHISVNPQPDIICVRCDLEGHELEWASRYAADIPKVFITCDECAHKFSQYITVGEVYYIDGTNDDLMLESLVGMLLEYKSQERLDE